MSWLPLLRPAPATGGNVCAMSVPWRHEIAEKQEEVEHVEASLARIRSKSKLASSFRCQAKWGVATASIGLANCKREISKLKAFSQSPSASSQ